MLITNDGRDIVSASQRRQYEDAETEAAQLNPVIDFYRVHLGFSDSFM